MTFPEEEATTGHMEQPTSADGRSTEETKPLFGSGDPGEPIDVTVGNGISNGYSKPRDTTPRAVQIDDPQQSPLYISPAMNDNDGEENGFCKIQMERVSDRNSGQNEEKEPPQGTAPCYKFQIPQWFGKKVPLWTLILLLVSAVIVIIVTFFLSKSNSEPLSPPPADCKDWIKMNDRCYFLSEGVKNWTASERFCNNQSSFLIIINNNTKNDLDKLNINEDFWIGLRRDQNKWKWIDGTDYKGEMVDNDSQLSCASLNKRIWTLACSTARRFICSKTVGGVTP